LIPVKVCLGGFDLAGAALLERMIIA